MYQFNNDTVTHVPTCALVEDVQTLAKAILNADWDSVQVVMECLCSTIDAHTVRPESMQFQPTESSLIAMSCENGIITREDGSDILCAAGYPVSDAMFNGVCQCSENCPFRKKGCAPDEARVMLPGYLYEYGKDDEGLLAYLKKK